MAKTKTLHEVKQAKKGKQGKKNTVTDADYSLRDIGSADDNRKNVTNITPKVTKGGE